jgi:predicted RNase H-related nuclease YkuK (DUF458 family)
MKRVFKTIDEKIVNVVDHTLGILKKNPDTRIYVGTDSINITDKSVFATVIAYRYNQRGAHLIFDKIRIPRISDDDYVKRLRKEVDLSLEIAMYLNDKGIHVHYIDLDLNEDEDEGSYKVLQYGKGYCLGIGITPNTKPNETPSARAADHICRGIMVC